MVVSRVRVRLARCCVEPRYRSNGNQYQGGQRREGYGGEDRQGYGGAPSRQRRMYRGGGNYGNGGGGYHESDGGPRGGIAESRRDSGYDYLTRDGYSEHGRNHRRRHGSGSRNGGYERSTPDRRGGMRVVDDPYGHVGDRTRRIHGSRSRGKSTGRGRPSGGLYQTWLGDVVRRLNGRENIEMTFDSLSDDQQLVLLQPRNITTVLTNIRSLDSALDAFRFLQHACGGSEQTENVFAYSTLLSKCAKTAAWSVARDLIDEMWENRVAPNDLSFSCAIQACKAAEKHREAIKIFEKSKAMGEGPGRVSYNSMISIYTEVGEWKQAVGLVLEMWTSGVTPDTLTYDQALKACEMGKSSAEALRLLNEMETMAIQPSGLTISRLLMVASATQHWQMSLVVLDRVENMGIRPNAMNYRLAIDICQKEGQVDVVKRLLDDMEHCLDVNTSVSHYTAAINAYQKGNQPELGIALYEKMRREGKCSDEYVYSSVIAACDTIGDWDRAVRVLDEMKEDGMDPGVFAYTGVISTLAKASQSEKALELLTEMREQNVSPNELTYSALMMACQKSGKWAEAIRLLDDMKHEGLKANDVVLSQAIGILWEEGFYRDALKMLLNSEKGGMLSIEMGTMDKRFVSIDLHGLTAGAASACICVFFLRVRRRPEIVGDTFDIITGWGRHSKEKGESTMRESLEYWFTEIGCPIEASSTNDGRMTISGDSLRSWIKSYSEEEFLPNIFPSS